jgi:hypothetical protein
MNPRIKHLNIGTNRGERRVWIEGPILADHGWPAGTRYDREVCVETGKIHLTREVAGRYKVSGTADRPIIDLGGKWMTRWVDASEAESVEVVVTSTTVRITA